MFVIALGLLMLLSACSSASPTGPEAARALIDDSAAAMGGWAELDAVKSQEIIAIGSDLEPLQAVEPNGENPTRVAAMPSLPAITTGSSTLTTAQSPAR